MKTFSLIVALIGSLVVPAPLLAQTYGNDRTPSRPGSESVRLQSSWGTFRTAAADLLDWKVGSEFASLTFFEAATKADALGLAFIEGVSTQQVSGEISRKLDHRLSADEIDAVKNKLRALNLRMAVYRVDFLDADDASRRSLFAFATNLGVETIVAPFNSGLPAIDALANEFGVNVTLVGHAAIPVRLIQELEGRTTRLGAGIDFSRWISEGVSTRDGLKSIGDRLMYVMLSDGTGLQPFLEELYGTGHKPLFLSIRGGGAADASAGLAQSLDRFEQALHPVMTRRVEEISRSEVGQIRGPDRLSPEVKERIAAALPREALAKPKKARKLLVLDINIGWRGHDTIPHGNYALQRMGEMTGAYEAEFSNDLNNLKYPKIKEYDAIFLNSTVGQVFVDPEVRAGLARFVREGGGLGGLHGASYTSMDWPEYMEMLGAGEGPHRVETGVIRIDDPASPLTRAFEGKSFEYRDEFYRFYAHGPYSRENLRVLLSLDAEKSDIFGGRPLYTRPDKDYALSWIRRYGEGRVFYCSLGHTPELFMTPALAEHILGGIQFVLGDLEADATPSGSARREP